jgi:CRP-like cAMP-binding protein
MENPATVTAEMIEAGLYELRQARMEDLLLDTHHLVRRIYTAMESERRSSQEQISASGHQSSDIPKP